MNDMPTLVAALRGLQGECCGICGLKPDRLVVDHDHGSGMVRGLLCHACNVMEGKHSNCRGPRSCKYCRWAQRPAVTWLGWTVRYEPAPENFGRYMCSGAKVAEDKYWAKRAAAVADAMLPLPPFDPDRWLEESLPHGVRPAREANGAYGSAGVMTTPIVSVLCEAKDLAPKLNPYPINGRPMIMLALGVYVIGTHDELVAFVERFIDQVTAISEPSVADVAGKYPDLLDGTDPVDYVREMRDS